MNINTYDIWSRHHVIGKARLTADTADTLNSVPDSRFYFAIPSPRLGDADRLIAEFRCAASDDERIELAQKITDALHQQAELDPALCLRYRPEYKDWDFVPTACLSKPLDISPFYAGATQDADDLRQLAAEASRSLADYRTDLFEEGTPVQELKQLDGRLRGGEAV